MKPLFILLCTLLSISLISQNTHIITAENGLILRDKPNGEKIGNVPFGVEVNLVEKTEQTLSITDNGKEISGHWVKVKFENFPYMILYGDKIGYVFDGFLKEKKQLIEELNATMRSFPELAKYTARTDNEPIYLKGDFFGDGVKDLAILVKDSNDNGNIAFIDYGKKDEIVFLAEPNDSMGYYAWVGIFEKVAKGTPLWSNYEEDFIEYKDVAKKDKVYLKYDAIFIHELESCGGGFVYWKEGEFHWLQQE